MRDTIDPILGGPTFPIPRPIFDLPTADIFPATMAWTAIWHALPVGQTDVTISLDEFKQINLLANCSASFIVNGLTSLRNIGVIRYVRRGEAQEIKILIGRMKG
jgi:hypothetical protein